MFNVLVLRTAVFPSNDSVPKTVDKQRCIYVCSDGLFAGQVSARSWAKHCGMLCAISMYYMTPSGEGGGVGGNEGGGGLEGEVSRTSQALLEEERISEGWDKTVHTHLLALASSPVETLWPKDTLFRYIPTDSGCHSPCQQLPYIFK